MNETGGWGQAVFVDELLSAAVFDEADDAAIRLLPPALRGASPNLTHWHVVGEVFRNLRGWFPGARVRVDRDRREYGRPAGKRRPDIQFYNPDRRRATHVEVDTDARSMGAHIAARDLRRRSVFLRIDPSTGVLLEKQVFPAGAVRPVITRGTVAHPVALGRDDVFDPFDTHRFAG